MNKMYAAWLNREARERFGKDLCRFTTEELDQLDEQLAAEDVSA